MVSDAERTAMEMQLLPNRHVLNQTVMFQTRMIVITQMQGFIRAPRKYVVMELMTTAMDKLMSVQPTLIIRTKMPMVMEETVVHWLPT
jgi:hypothetical protein